MDRGGGSSSHHPVALLILPLFTARLVKKNYEKGQDTLTQYEQIFFFLYIFLWAPTPVFLWGFRCTHITAHEQLPPPPPLPLPTLETVPFRPPLVEFFLFWYWQKIDYASYMSDVVLVWCWNGRGHGRADWGCGCTRQRARVGTLGTTHNTATPHLSYITVSTEELGCEHCCVGILHHHHR